MKNFARIFLPIMCLNLALLSGCGKEEKKIALSFGDMNAQTVTDISIGDLNSFVEKKQSFLFAVSPQGCACWEAFTNCLYPYINEHHLICYHMEYKDFEDFASTYKVILTKGATTFVIFENGVNKVSMTSTNNDAMSKKDEFYKFMNKTVSFPKCYYINETNFDAIKASDKTAVVYFGRSTCGDCSFLEPNILKPYVESHSDMKNLYVLDCSKWYESEDKGQSMKDKYGLSNVNNPVYGYNKGVYPFFELIENGKYKSAAEAFNVKIENNVITDSYYSQDRLNNLQYLKDNASIATKVITGLELSSSDLNSYGGWEHTKALKYYQPIINAFLDYALPQTTF